MTLEGYKELYVNLDKHEKAVTKAAMEGLKQAGLNIIADAKQNLRSNNSVATGMLRASGKVQAVEGDKDSIDVGFFSQNSSNGYAYYVEYGTKASSKRKLGFMIPLIKAWLRKKGEPDGRGLQYAAFLIARKIIKKGTRPHPFFAPAVEKNKASVENVIANEVKQEL